MKKCFISLLLFFSIYSFAINFDQNFQVKTFSVNEGLSQFDAPRIIQDHFGFIWVSTYDGLNRFDGNGFVQFRHNPYNENSIHGNRVLNLFIDSKNNFWVVTESGKIDRFNYQTEQFEHFDFEPLKYAIITAFYEDKLHNYWIGTTNGLYKTSLVDNKFKVDGIYLNSTSPGFENFILCLIENENHGILVGTVSGGVLLSKQSDQIYSPSKFLPNVQINSFFKDADNTIWICNNYGLSYINSNVFKKSISLNTMDIQPFPDLLASNVRAMAAIDNQNCILLFNSSIKVLNIQSKTIREIKLEENSFFRNNIIKSLFVDNTKNIWVSSGQKGISKIDLYQKPNIIDGKKETEGMFVKGVFKDSRGRVWVGTNLNGMFYFDQNGPLKQIPTPKTNNPYTLISPSIVEDKRGDIWFCTNYEVKCFSYKTNSIASLNAVYPSPTKVILPFSLAIDRYDNMWVGCASGLIRVNLNDKNKPYKFVSIGSLSDMVSSEQISRLIYDSIHNMVWACTKDNGVTAIKLNKTGEISKITHLSHIESINSISSDHVWSVLLASDSTVWFGTDSGLNKCIVSGDAIQVVSVNNLRIIGNVKIMSLAEDRNRTIWLGTSQALYSYKPKTNTEKKYTVANGLFSSGMLEGMYADNSDKLYVGTINGLNWINTTPQPKMPYKSEVQIVDFKIFGKSIKSDTKLNKHLRNSLYNTSDIELNYNENNFTINFLSINYNDFDKNMYVYQLEGFDSDSITVDNHNRSVTYNNLPAGKYHFWVRILNNDNTLGGTKRELVIIVKSAPWLTLWAYLVYLLLISAVLYVVYRYLNREAKLKQQLVIKELENQHENEINNIRLRFHTNIAHDIRTPLTLIAGPLEDIKNNHAIIEDTFLSDRISIVDKNVSRLLYLVNQFLDFRRLLNDGSSLHPDIQVVNTVFSDIKKSFDGIAISNRIHFEFLIDVNDTHLIFDVDKLTKILFNLISNAFKYTPDGGDVFVFIEQQNETLVIKVQDTGCGISANDLPRIFDRFYQSSESSSGTGIGLALVKQLVEVCKGSIEAKSVLGEGSQFKVIIPCEIPTETPVSDTQSENLDEIVEIVNKESRGAMVLIVEDDEDLRAYLVKSFKDKFTVIQAGNGQEGFDKALRYTPDIILTDVMMPHVDGIALIKLIRNDYRTSHIPIIVLTAKTGENEEIKALEAGAEDFISKPFSTKSLLLKVNNYIRSLSGKKQPESVEIHSKILDSRSL
ncbi:MAG: ATP-binding protein [Paludibacter sp.]